MCYLAKIICLFLYMQDIFVKMLSRADFFLKNGAISSFFRESRIAEGVFKGDGSITC